MLVEGEEIFFVERTHLRGQVLLYAPRRSYLASVSTSLQKAILDSVASPLKSAFLGKLRTRRIIDIEQLLKEIRKANPILSVAITQNCSLRCTYCYASAGEEHRQASMTHDMIDGLLRAYFDTLALGNVDNYKTKVVEIKIMGGGEPTVEFAKLKFLVQRASELAMGRGLRCLFSMPTNGVYGDEIREFLLTNFQSLSLSFDGPAHIQNLHRPLPNGDPSFPIVFETAKFFRDRKAPFALRATISDYSLQHIKEVVDFFHDNFPGVSISLEPLNQVGRALHNKTVASPDQASLANELVRVLDYASKKGIRLVNTASSEYNVLRPVFCSSVAVPNWTVVVDGRIYCCERENAPDEFMVGHFDFSTNQFILDQGRMDRIRSMNVFSYPECKDCFCKYHCAGDCPDRRMSDRSDCDGIRKVGVFVLEQKVRAVEELRNAN